MLKDQGPLDISSYQRPQCLHKAAVFQPGTKTDTLIRFSTVAGERGSLIRGEIRADLH